MTLGQADSWLAKPWNPPEQLLYPVVDELLSEWPGGTKWPRPAAIQIVGERPAARSYELHDLLVRSELRYNFYPADTDEGREVLRKANQGEDKLPVVVVPDGRVLVQPTNTEAAVALGVQTRPEVGRYDLAVVGGGPAGLSAAVYAASEGLRTLLLEREAFGGQAGTSARNPQLPGLLPRHQRPPPRT